MERSRSSTRSSTSSPTRSILLTTMRSAKATCSTASFSTPSGLDLVEVVEDVLGIDEGDDGVEPQLSGHLVVHEEGLRHRGGIGEAGGLDEDVVEAVAAAHEIAEDADEVAAHGAADAPVVHLEHLLIGVDDEGVIDPDLT